VVPEWVDRSEFPFIVHTFDGQDGRMAYVDEGHGDVLLFVHGNPSWSFVFRHLIKSLRGQYRCIACDHLGFGLSEKPDRIDYSPQAHRRRLDEFVTHMELDRLTLVGHDYGGPIAASWAIDHPDRVQGLVMFNTWLWSLTHNAQAMQLFRNFDNIFNRLYYTHLRASPKFFLPVLVAGVEEMPKHVLNQFMRPFSEHQSRLGPYEFARHLIRSSGWFDELWDRKQAIENVPMLLLWGEKDTFSGEAGLSRFVDNFPQARPVRLPNTGNFVPQEAFRRTTVEISGFLRTLSAPSYRPGFLD
jgi:haloalkane dehalogenase